MSPRSTASRSISSSTKGLPSLRSCRNSRNSSLTSRSSKIGDGAGREGLQLDKLGLARSTPALDRWHQGMLAVHLIHPIGREDEDVRGSQPAGHVVEQLARAGVGPLQVFENEQQGAIASSVAQQ